MDPYSGMPQQPQYPVPPQQQYDVWTPAQQQPQQQYFGPSATAPPSRPSGLVWAVIGLSVLVVGLAAALVAVLVSGGSADGDPKPAAAGASAPAYDITVEFTLDDFDTALNSCEGQGGYGDIGSGAPVTLRNGEGDLLGSDFLGVGRSEGGSCLWTTEFTDIPAGEKFYVAEVGDRGELSYSEAQLKEEGFTISAHLGD